MKERPVRQIIVIYDFSEASETALVHGINMCQCLKTHLTLVYPVPSTASPDEKERIKLLMAEKIQFLEQTTTLRVQAFAPDKSLSAFYKALYQKIDAIMIVIGFEQETFCTGLSLHSVLKMVRQSSIPWLLVPQDAQPNDFQHIVLPISYQREEKEKIIWASYFYRLNKSITHVLVPEAQDAYLQRGININLQFLQKLYQTIDAQFEQYLLSISFYDIHEYALQFAHNQQYAPVLCMISRQADIMDLIFGIKEKPIIFNKQHIPVLCLSSQMPMYVVCS